MVFWILNHGILNFKSWYFEPAQMPSKWDLWHVNLMWIFSFISKLSESSSGLVNSLSDASASRRQLTELKTMMMFGRTKDDFERNLRMMPEGEERSFTCHNVRFQSSHVRVIIKWCLRQNVDQRIFCNGIITITWT